MFVCRVQQSPFVPHERLLATPAARSGRPAPVREDTEEPRPEPLRVITLCQGAIGADERILQRFFRILPSPQHPYRVPGKLRPVLRHQNRVCPGISGKHPRHNGRVVVLYG